MKPVSSPKSFHYRYNNSREVTALIQRRSITLEKNISEWEQCEWFTPVVHIECVQKKETKLFLGISQTNLGRFSWNLIHGFLNKFAIKWCKTFPPHLNSVSTLPCKTWNAHCARATIEVIRKETPEFIPPQLWPPNSPDLNPVDYRVWEISQEMM